MPVNLPSFLRRGTPDIEALKSRRDTRGLISALRHQDPDVQWRAAAALGSFGPDAIQQLIAGLRTRDHAVQLGIIEALGEIRHPLAVEPLVGLLRDPSVEIRWEAALALGEIGDPRARAPLLAALRDPDRYVRYGTALALGKLGWTPANDEEKGYLLLGHQDWHELAALGPAALPALGLALKDREKTVRIRAVETLGALGDPGAVPEIMRALRDPDDEVRWQAVLAGPRCGIAPMYLPRGLSQRPRIRKNPAVAAFLNFVLPGQGYLYLGRWWGVIIFQIDITLTLWLFASLGDDFTYGLLLPVYLILSVHAWYLARKLPEM
jgi:hypothetical protein